MYDDDFVVFTAQTFEIKDDPDWTGPTLDPSRILTVGFQNGNNYGWDIGSGSHVVIPPVPPGVTPTLVEETYPTEQANFYLWSSGGKLYVNINPVTASFEVDVITGYYGFNVTQDGAQRWVTLYDCIGQMYDDDFVVFTAQTFEIKDDPDWTGPTLDPSRILTVGFQNGNNYGWDIVPQCPECSTHPVILNNVTFERGTHCLCTDSTSITISSGVTIESEAKVIFKAPKITVKSGAQFKSGSEVSLKHQ